MIFTLEVFQIMVSVKDYVSGLRETLDRISEYYDDGYLPDAYVLSIRCAVVVSNLQKELKREADNSI